MQAVNEALIEETELRLLLEGVRNCYGFDFRDYAEESLKRRLWGAVRDAGAATVSAYQDKVLHDPACLDHLLRALTAHDLSLFEDPPFWEAFRAIVVPMLRTYPSVQIWVPGCATGEDAYTIAIVLHEGGSYPGRVFTRRISATPCYSRPAPGPFLVALSPRPTSPTRNPAAF